MKWVRKDSLTSLIQATIFLAIAVIALLTVWLIFLDKIPEAIKSLIALALVLLAAALAFPGKDNPTGGQEK